MSERKRKDHLDDDDDIKRRHVDAEADDDEHKVIYTCMSLYCDFNKSRLSTIKVLHITIYNVYRDILGCGRRRKQHIKYNRYMRVSTVSCHMFIEAVNSSKMILCIG